MKGGCLLTDTLNHLPSASHYTATQWDLLVRQARSANLLAHLGYLLDQDADLQIPTNIHRHFRSARLLVERQNMAVRWEVSLLRDVLYPLSIPVVALKGAAYLLAGLPNSNGRLFHDIDILVPRPALEEVESRLRRRGWRTTHNNAYDQRYYRRWMHELPPLMHIQRQTVLDVHHSILPLTARIHPDPGEIIGKAVAHSGNEGIYWLSPEDMVLHSMTHLFHDGELENGLRDLIDIHLLLNEFRKAEGFWTRLTERAQLLELTRPLYYGLRYVERVFRIQAPENARRSVSVWGPGKVFGKFMDALFLRALQPAHETCRTSVTFIARRLLYIRSHYLRMPFRLLIPHLLHKALMAERDDEIPRELKNIIDNNN